MRALKLRERLGAVKLRDRIDATKLRERLTGVTRWRRPESVTVAKDDEAPTNIASLTLLLWVLGIGFFGGFGAWAAIGKIQGGVVAAGEFDVRGAIRSVDHLEGGIVKAIHVEEGDTVAEGDLLVSLDRTRAEAQMKILLGQLATAMAREARLQAERDGADRLTVTPELEGLLKADRSFADIVATQEDILNGNRGSDGGEIAIQSERILQMEERVRGIDARLEIFQRQLELASEEARTLQAALEKGLSRREPVKRAQEQEIIMLGRIGDAESEREDLLKQIAEIEERQAQVHRQRQRQIADEMQIANAEIVDLKQRVMALSDIIRRHDIRAPVAGRIIGFDINTVGAVVDEGGRILQIVPQESDYEIVARVATGDIDEIGLGDTARVRLTAYSFRKVAPVEGKVRYVAADSIFDSDTGVASYEIRVEVPQETLDALPGVRVVPGMPVQVIVATGEASIASHILDPILGGLETAMVEGD